MLNLCIVLFQHTCPAGYMQLVKFIRHALSACRSMRFCNLLKSRWIMDYIFCHIPWWCAAGQSWAELNCWNGNEIYTDLLSLTWFVRHSAGDPRDSTLHQRHRILLRLRHAPQLNWTQLTYYACLHMFYALTGAICTVMLRHLQHCLGKHCSVVQWEKRNWIQLFVTGKVNDKEASRSMQSIPIFC